MSTWVSMRLRQPLTASLPGDDGLAEAMVQWLDYEIAHVLTRDRLPIGKGVTLYVDVPPQGRMVELTLDVQELARPTSTSNRGWIHRARWSAVEAGEGVFLDAAMPGINPAARKATAWASRSRESGSESSPPRSRSPSAPRPSTSSVNSSSRRRRGRGNPPELALSMGASGGPPNLLARFVDADQLAEFIQLEGTGFWLRTELEATLPVGGELLLAIQLPDHQFVQAQATIRTSHGRFYELQAQVPDGADLAMLRRVLGESDSGTPRRS